MKSQKVVVLFLSLFFFCSTSLYAARYIEKLDRGLVAIPSGNGIFLSWRLLGYEDQNVAFDVFRDGAKLNEAPLTGATNFFDEQGNTNSVYQVRTVVNGQYTESSEEVSPWGEITRRIPLSRPSGNHAPNDASVGDLDGDGKWDLVLKWEPWNAKDNSQDGMTDDVYLDGMKLDGTRLWRINLGRNIRAGAHYTQFLVADFDLDGKAEVMCKTAPGTRDASGNYLSKGPAASADHSADYRNNSGYVLSGPEYLTVFSSEGLELATVDYNPPRGNVSSWGDNYGNRVDRFLAAVAYLDGEKPSGVFQRGYYSRMTLAAWDWDGTNLVQRWFFDSNSPGNGEAYSQGNHNLSVGDVDADGFDEIIQGATAIDHDGTFMYATGLGHGDAIHLSDLDPDRPGLEVMSPHEEKRPNWPGTEVHDARTGEILFEVRVDNTDVGRGMAADIDGNHRGFEIWSSASGGIYNIDGTRISTSGASINFRIYWDGDLQDELLDSYNNSRNMKIDDWNGSGFDRLLSSDTRYGNYVGVGNNGTKANPVISADILGDWREEFILRETGDEALILYSTTIPTTHRLYTLMHDPHYRVSVAWQNVAYNQPPHLGFYIGSGLDNVQAPDIIAVGGKPRDCAGVEEGQAWLDDCGRCVEGTTGRSPCSAVIEAENFCAADGTVDINHNGYSGGGFLNLVNEESSKASWGWNVPQAQSETIFLKYANGSDADRPVVLSINGTDTYTIQMAPTASWDVWEIEEVTVSLQAGFNLAEISSSTATGPGNLDLWGFSSMNASSIGCEAAVGTLTEMTSGKTPQFTLKGRELFVQLPLQQQSEYSIMLLDAMGNDLTAQIPGATELQSGTIRLPELAAGVYFVNLVRAGQIQQREIWVHR